MRFFVAVGDPQAVPGSCVAAAPSLLQAGRGMPSSLCHTPAMPPILATQTEAQNTQKYLPSPLQSLSLQQEGEPSPWRPEMPPKMQKKRKWNRQWILLSLLKHFLAKPQVSPTSNSEVFASLWAVKIFPKPAKFCPPPSLGAGVGHSWVLNRQKLF